MNRNIVLGFAGGLVFAASLVAGLIVADAATDQGGGQVTLPGALGDPVEIVTATPSVDPDAPIDFDQPIEPTQAAYLPVASGGSGSSPSGGSGSGGTPPGTPSDTDGAAPDASPPITIAPLSPDPFDTAEIDSRFEGLFPGDIFFEFREFPPFRFLDFCADTPGSDGCPAGVGGTVLFPLGDPTLEDFRLGANLGDAAARGVECFGDDDGTMDPTDHAVFVWANQPADFQITYYPGENRDVRTVLAFGNAAPDDPEFVRWTEDAEAGRLDTSPWPRGCFILTERSSTATLYTVEVEATSFTGATASQTYLFDVTEGPRPPVVVVPLSDSDVRLLIPVKRSTQAATMSIVRQDDATSCADLEAAGRYGEVVPDTESGRLFDWGNQAAYGDAADSWPYDRAYDGQRVINVAGLDGGPYLVCVWWLESPDRSFDGSVIVERERRWITTPNHTTAIIRLIREANATRRDEITADSFTIGFSCGSETTTLSVPGLDLRPTDSRRRTDVVCDYEGRRLETPTIGFYITPRGFRHEFALALDPSSADRTQNFEVDLSTRGLSFDEPGPTLLFEASFSDGFAGGTDRWQTGVPIVFEPPPAAPDALPDEIQIDTLASGVDPFDRDTIQVTAEFDRPVRLTASLLGDPCLTGPEPSYDSNVFNPGAFEQFYTFFLDGLCTRTRYSVLLEVEDAAGNTASFADVAPGLPEAPGARYFRGTGWTDGYHVSYTAWTLERTPLEPIDVTRFELTIDGVSIDLRRTDRCFRRVLEAPTSSGTAVVGNEVTVTLDIIASSEYVRGGSGCTPSERGRALPYHGSVTTTIPIEDFEGGDVAIPITIESPLSDGGGPFWDTGVGINLRITG